MLNFLLFIILSLLPERGSESGMNPNLRKANEQSFLKKWIPQDKSMSAFIAAITTSVISVLLAVLFFNYLNEYGWSLFVALPFLSGFGSVIIHGYNKELTFRDALYVAMLSIVLINLAIFILAYEGLICLVMALPLFLILGLGGASLGWIVHRNYQSVNLNVVSTPFLLIPLLAIVELSDNQLPPEVSVETEIFINATKQEVWDELLAFSEIDEPKKWLFKTGIAYPTHAEIEGNGVGAVRRCYFTTGSFVEPITIWDEPNLLEFSVMDQPHPMMEWSIYQDLEIEHLDGYFKSNKGQFRLKKLPNGVTQLTGTTWYQHDVWPTFYWKIWSDYILHQIHFRVLNHIKKRAEG